MEAFTSVDWDALFGLSLPVTEILIRGTAMYWFLFLLFRFVIRRDVGAVGIADMLVLVIVADAAQNGMAGEYTSVTDGMILVSTLIGWNVFLDWLSFRYPAIQKLAQPRPLLLIQRGHMLKHNMRRELITEAELWSKLRENGIESMEEVKTAYMESDGMITVIKQE